LVLGNSEAERQGRYVFFCAANPVRKKDFYGNDSIAKATSCILVLASAVRRID